MASEDNGSGEPGMFTVMVAVPVTTVPSGFLAIAVIVVVPFDTEVAIPVAGSIVATEVALELHVAG
jgi:hypothetical protein